MRLIRFAQEALELHFDRLEGGPVGVYTTSRWSAKSWDGCIVVAPLKTRPGPEH